jgi:HAD superfamily hydrolase (TIGR01509 family)
MSTLKAVLFDLDDTLFDHHRASCSALEALRGQYAAIAGVPFELLVRQHSDMLEELHLEMLRGRYTSDEARAERFQRLFRWAGHALAEPETSAVTRFFRASYLQARHPLPGALALLERLKPLVTIAIVTNNLVDEQRDKLTCCGMDHLIDVLVTSEEVGEPKPHPAMFEAALARAGCAPGEAVMLGDSWAVDIVGAHALGIRAVWLNRHGRPCPQPGLAHEISALEPLDETLALLLGSTSPGRADLRAGHEG